MVTPIPKPPREVVLRLRAERKATARAEHDALVSDIHSEMPYLHERDVLGLAGDILAYRRGRSDNVIDRRLMRLLGAKHPLLESTSAR